MSRPEMSLLLGILLAALLREAGAVTCFAGNSSFPLCTTCSGQCVDTIGCYCGNDPILCLPDPAERCNPDTTDCCPPYFYWNSTLTCCSDVLQCQLACGDDEVCTGNAGTAECKCDPTKYLHANLSDISPTVQCDGSSMTVSLKKCLLERFKYSVTDMHFTNTSTDSCSVVTYMQLVGSERWVTAQAILREGLCGNEMTVNANDKTVTYSNVLYVPPDNSSGIIISGILQLPFSCTYSLTMQTSLQTVVRPILGVITLPIANGSGPLFATMAAYMSDSFARPYSVGDTLTLGNPLYIGIFTTFADADKFTLRADKCVASPSNNPTQGGVDLILSGCPVTDDVDVQILHNGDLLEVMFQIVTFAFTDQSEVYMSCDVSLCPITTPDTCKCSSA